MKSKTKAFLVFLGALFYPIPLFSYVDPGLGGMIFQIAGIVFFGLIAWWFGVFRKLRQLVLKLVLKKKTGD